MTFYAVPSGLGYFITEKGLGSGVTIGLLISIVTIASFVLGIIFHYIKDYLKGWTVTTGLLLLTLGMLGIGLSYNIFGLAISLSLVGIGLGIVAPNIYLQTSLDSSNDVTLSLAIVSCFSFLGQFTSPIINGFIQDVFNYHSTESVFIISAYIGAFAIIIVIINKFIKVYVPRNII